MIALLAASFVQVRLRAMHDSCAMLKLGLGLLIVNSLAIAVLNEWVPTFPDTRELSWNTILILIYAIAVPTTPSKMFAACVVAASADPLAVGVANLRGLPEPTFVQGFLLYYPRLLMRRHGQVRHRASSDEPRSHHCPTAWRLRARGTARTWRNG
jgi:hypothetical protein